MKRFVLLAVLLFVYGCAYSFVGQNSSMMGGIKRLYIDNVVNLTTQPNLQIYLKGDLINTMNLDSRVSVVESKDGADGILRVSILHYVIEPISYDESGLSSRYRCTIDAKVSLISKNGEELLNNREVSSYRDFNASGSVDATEKARREVSKEVIKDLADKIKDLLFVGF
ncbi:LPS assembly lipoprotein LptE [Hippea sp. KM1]|uniref:LPS assembly lipoprotein LptE n=1 Tax=Hippea sp. KM1 TaxID=944481 RepID=UPI00046CC81F|nr:LptE family protein [Hippea sp. KM1]